MGIKSPPPPPPPPGKKREQPNPLSEDLELSDVVSADAVTPLAGATHDEASSVVRALPSQRSSPLPPPPPPPHGKRQSPGSPIPMGPAKVPSPKTTPIRPPPPPPPNTRNAASSSMQSADAGKESVQDRTARAARIFVGIQKSFERDAKALTKYTPEQLHNAIQSGTFSDKALLFRAGVRASLSAMREHKGVLQLVADSPESTVELASAPQSIVAEGDPTETYIRISACSLTETGMTAHLKSLQVPSIAALLAANGVKQEVPPSPSVQRFGEVQSAKATDTRTLASYTAEQLHQKLQKNVVDDDERDMLRRTYRRYDEARYDNIPPENRRMIAQELRDRHGSNMPSGPTDEEIFAAWVKSAVYGPEDVKIDAALRGMGVPGLRDMLVANGAPARSKSAIPMPVQQQTQPKRSATIRQPQPKKGFLRRWLSGE